MSGLPVDTGPVVVDESSTESPVAGDGEVDEGADPLAARDRSLDTPWPTDPHDVDSASVDIASIAAMIRRPTMARAYAFDDERRPRVW